MVICDRSIRVSDGLFTTGKQRAVARENMRLQRQDFGRRFVARTILTNRPDKTTQSFTGRFRSYALPIVAK